MRGIDLPRFFEAGLEGFFVWAIDFRFTAESEHQN